jgi:hypothetical protein
MPPNFSNRSAIRFMILWSAIVSSEGRKRYQHASCSLSALSTSSIVGNQKPENSQHIVVHCRLPVARAFLDTGSAGLIPKNERAAIPCTVFQRNFEAAISDLEIWLGPRA